MKRRSKKLLLVALFVVAMMCSRTIFWFIHDPEGPNLLIDTALALLIYSLFLAVYFSIIRREKHL